MLPAEKSKSLFITGTDTGVGKTLVAAALAKVLTDQGLNVGIMKPVETGVSDTKKLGPDGKLLKWSAGSELHDDQICPYRLRAPLAPAAAASQENTQIDFNNLIHQAQKIIEAHDFTIIEGTGGLMVPLAGGVLMADFAGTLRLPLAVICRPGLGTINHTLLTLFAAKNMDLDIVGYLINNMPTDKTLAEETVAQSLAVITSDKLFGILDSVIGTEQEKIFLLAKQLVQMKTLSLLTSYLPDVFS
jgi:dethiobiotin synthetase